MCSGKKNGRLCQEDGSGSYREETTEIACPQRNLTPCRSPACVAIKPMSNLVIKLVPSLAYMKICTRKLAHVLMPNVHTQCGMLHTSLCSSLITYGAVHFVYIWLTFLNLLNFQMKCFYLELWMIDLAKCVEKDSQQSNMYKRRFTTKLSYIWTRSLPKLATDLKVIHTRDNTSSPFFQFYPWDSNCWWQLGLVNEKTTESIHQSSSRHATILWRSHETRTWTNWLNPGTSSDTYNIT